ncbi:hypothetical protein AHAS_Ahas16G0290600 [Arachis hypogaea]
MLPYVSVQVGLSVQEESNTLLPIKVGVSIGWLNYSWIWFWDWDSSSSRNQVIILLLVSIYIWQLQVSQCQLIVIYGILVDRLIFNC